MPAAKQCLIRTAKIIEVIDRIRAIAIVSRTCCQRESPAVLTPLVRLLLLSTGSCTFMTRTADADSGLGGDAAKKRNNVWMCAA